jgi:hypothetical protein
MNLSSDGSSGTTRTVPGDLHHVCGSSYNCHHLINLFQGKLKFDLEHTHQLVENRWGHIQVHESRLGGKKTPIGRASPENGGNQYIGIEDSLHLSRLMENVIHKSLAFFLRHPPEIHPTGPAYSFKLFAILIDESVKTLQPPQELS